MTDADLAKWVATGGGGLAGLWMLGRYAFRHFGKDSLEFTKDRVETDIVTSQFARIKDLESANSGLVAQLLEKAEEVGKLKGQVDALAMKTQMQEVQIQHLTENLARLEKHVNEIERRSQ
jgi:ribosomal protein S15P/S13E